MEFSLLVARYREKERTAQLQCSTYCTAQTSVPHAERIDAGRSGNRPSDGQRCYWSQVRSTGRDERNTAPWRVKLGTACLS